MGNLSAALNFSFKRKPCEAFVVDRRLWIPRKRVYAYPDIMIIKGELQFQEGRKDTLTNPSIIIEVLSKSTQNYDKGESLQPIAAFLIFENIFWSIGTLHVLSITSKLNRESGLSKSTMKPMVC
jgi:Uma2 family endonuclease